VDPVPETPTTIITERRSSRRIPPDPKIAPGVLGYTAALVAPTKSI
jgi:hypothetical protein